MPDNIELELRINSLEARVLMDEVVIRELVNAVDQIAPPAIQDPLRDIANYVEEKKSILYKQKAV